MECKKSPITDQTFGLQTVESELQISTKHLDVLKEINMPRQFIESLLPMGVCPFPHIWKSQK